eukprot:618826-Rhodomonas_salina.2
MTPSSKSQEFAIRACSQLEDFSIDLDYGRHGASKRSSRGDCANRRAGKEAVDVDRYTGCAVTPARKQADHTELKKDPQTKDFIAPQERLDEEIELQRHLQLLQSLAKAAEAERERLAKERALKVQADIEQLVRSVHDAQSAGFVQLVRRGSTDAGALSGTLSVRIADMRGQA